MNICWTKNKQKFEPRAILLQWLNYDYYLVIHKINLLNLTMAYPFLPKIRLSCYIQSILKLPNNVFYTGKCSCLCLIIDYIKLYGLYLLGKFSLYQFFMISSVSGLIIVLSNLSQVDCSKLDLVLSLGIPIPQ